MRSVVHAAFDLERTYQAPVARVWKALTDLSAKEKWFAGTPGKWQLLGSREHGTGLLFDALGASLQN